MSVGLQPVTLPRPISLERPRPGVIRRKYGLPFKGFVSSVPAHLCPSDRVWGTNLSAASPYSENYLYDPIDGKLLRRLGISNVGGTTGILAASTAAFPRAMIALDSPTISDLGDGYPTHCVLYGEGVGAADDDATLYLRSSIGGVNYELGKEFGANHYPGAAAATANIKCPPYFRTTDGTWGRLNSSAKRLAALGGSDSMLEVGDQLVFSCLHSLPLRWNKRYNESAASGSQNLRLYPAGRIPPLGRLSVATGTANATGTWRANDKFFLAVVYHYRDGTWSAPMIPRNINDQLPSGFGLFTLGASCDYITVSGIPIGEDDCDGRAIMRSPKKWGDGSNTQEPDPADLRLAAYIPNNTDTTVILNDGNDVGLALRDDILPASFAGSAANALAWRQWPSPARHIWASRNRIFMGFTKPHPGAIVLAPDVNVGDDSASILTTTYEFALAAGVLTLYKGANTTAITADSTRTLQQVVDSINATTDSGANGGKWHACLVPGADGNTPCGTGAGANQNLASTTGIDVGDTAGRVRSFSPSYPGLLFFSTTYLSDPARKGPFKSRWRMSEGGPHLGVSTFVDMWPAGNIRTGLDSWGTLMGGAPLLDGTLIFFSKAIVLFRNTVSGDNGFDSDFHPEVLFWVGCLSSTSIAYGDGWAGCLTERGYLCFDGTKEGLLNITPDIYNTASRDGQLSYEIDQSSAAVGKDGAVSRFTAKVLNGKLNICYRVAATTYQRMIYDFSGSVNQAGLAQLLRPDGTLWGWSTVLRYGGIEPIMFTQVRKSTGLETYGATLAHANGRIEQYDTGNLDNGSTIGATLVLPLDLSGTTLDKQAQQLTLLYQIAATGGLVALNLNDGNTGYQTPDIALPNTGASSTFKRVIVPLPSAARAPCVAHRIIMGTFLASERMQVWGAELELVVTARYL